MMTMTLLGGTGRGGEGGRGAFVMMTLLRGGWVERVVEEH